MIAFFSRFFSPSPRIPEREKWELIRDGGSIHGH